MTKLKPTILLDIDGVIIPTRDSDPWGHFAVTDWQGDPRLISEEMRSRVVQLFHLGEVRWCSSWNERSIELSRSLVLPQTGFLPIDIQKTKWSKDFSFDRLSWKLHSITEWDRGNDPLIWIDDNIERDAFRWERERKAPTLLIKTEEETGLTDTNLEEIADFLRTLTSASD